jgi:hypothetical protein
MKESEPEVVETDDEIELPEGSTPLPPLSSMLDLFNWYKRYFCQPSLRDCRGYKVDFREDDFIHLVKITDKYGKEPKHRPDAVRKIKSGELKMFLGTKHFPPNFSIQRAKELVCAVAILEKPEMIVENWQPLGSANPGEAYIRNFGKDGRRRFRVLICGLAGTKRLPVTMFPRQRFRREETANILWP